MSAPRKDDLCPKNEGQPHWYDGGVCYVCGEDEPDWQAQIDVLAARLAEAERLLREAVDAWRGDGPPLELDRIDAFLRLADSATGRETGQNGLMTPDSAEGGA